MRLILNRNRNTPACNKVKHLDKGWFLLLAMMNYLVFFSISGNWKHSVTLSFDEKLRANLFFLIIFNLFTSFWWLDWLAVLEKMISFSQAHICRYGVNKLSRKPMWLMLLTKKNKHDNNTGILVFLKQPKWASVENNTIQFHPLTGLPTLWDLNTSGE